LPTKDNNSSSNLKDLASNGTSPSNAKSAAAPTTNGSHLSASKLNGNVVKIECKKLTLNEEFKCRAEELYRVFVNVDV
jgi:hypothetical protein